MQTLGIESRKRLWIALSDLYLDTDQSYFYKGISDLWDELNLSPAEVEDILFHEVHPVLYKNLLGIAGEWAGFNEEWLCEQCQKQMSKKKSRFYTFRVKNWLGGLPLIMTKLEFKALKNYHIKKAR